MPGPPLVPNAKLGPLSNQLDVEEALRRGTIARINELFTDEFAAFGFEMSSA